MKEIIPITPSPGGAVAPKDIVGRDEEINLFWDVLEKQGIALFAERRFGKSSILRKMEAESKNGFITIYKPVEGISSPEHLAAGLLDRIKELDLIDEGLFKNLENFYNKTTEVIDEVKGVKLKKLEYSWQKQLNYLLSKLTEKHKGKKIIIILDEFSIFLDEISNNEASVVIGFLRNIAYLKEYENIRFVYCGSIGIDLVLDKIKEEGHNIGDPLNHMYKHEPQPFTNDNSKHFGKCLNLGCELNLSDKLIEQICERANHIPYFIDVVFDKLSKSKNASQHGADNAFEEILYDTKGKESIRHFYDRIEDFYPKKEISIYILNFISKSANGASETEIANNVFSNSTASNRLEINKEIERLKNDGYLFRMDKNSERAYDFKYSLLKQWWKINKAF